MLWCVVVCCGVGRDTLRTLPCVRSKRPRVHRQQVHMFYTCGPVPGSHTWPPMLRTCSTTQTYTSEQGGDTGALPAPPVSLLDAPRIQCEPTMPSTYRRLRVCHTHRSTVAFPCVSACADAPESVPRASITRLFHWYVDVWPSVSPLLPGG